MIRDFYFRKEDDPNYMDGTLETSDEIECLLNQIFMIIKTNQGEVLGGVNFGADLDGMLFNTAGDIFSFKQRVLGQIQTYSLIAQKYAIDLKPSSYDSDYHKVAVLDINIEGHNLLGFMINAAEGE